MAREEAEVELIEKFDLVGVAWKDVAITEYLARREAEARAEKAEGALRQIAQIAHTGGLDELTEADALVKIRGLSMLWWDIEETNRRQQEKP